MLLLKLEIQYHYSVIGVPSEAEWPEDSPLLRSSFESYPQQRLNAVIPEICSEGEDLLMVRFNYLCLKK